MQTVNKLLLMALFLAGGAGAFAGTGWHVTISNRTCGRVIIYPGGSDWWDPYSFGETQEMGPWESKRFYTEQKRHIFTTGPGILGINIQYFIYAPVHCEMWYDHDFTVKQNLKYLLWGGALFDAGVGTDAQNVNTGITADWTAVTLTGTPIPWRFYVTFTLDYRNASSPYAPAARDVDGDAKADPAMISNENWYVWSSRNGYTRGGPYNLGLSGFPLLGDMDGDRFADPIVMDTLGNWYIWFSSQGYQRSGPYAFGVPGTPLVADIDGDGLDDPIVQIYDTCGMIWCVWPSGDNYLGNNFCFGGFGTQPAAGDIDGDGKADLAAMDENGNWSFALSGSNYALIGPVAFCAAGKPILADSDGDRLADPIVVEENSEIWHVWPSNSGYVNNKVYTLDVP